MQSRAISAVIAVALVAVAVVLFVVLRDGGGDEPAATTATTTEAQRAAEDRKQERRQQGPEPVQLVVRGGEPVGGVKELEYTRGDEVRLEVRSDAADEVHVHGYDLFEDVAPGKPARLEFVADIEGGFEVELEDAHVQLAEFTVEPG